MKSKLVFDVTEPTSTSLLARVQQYDQEAWQRLTNLYGPVVYRAARRARLQESDAADIVQEVFRAVANHIEGFRRDREGDSFRAWLWTITRSKLLDHYRQHARRQPAKGGTDAYEQLQNLPDDKFDEDECGREVLAGVQAVAREALALLKTDFEEKTWHAFWLSAIDGKSAAEVGRELNMSVAAVYKAKSRVLARLRDELSGL